MMVTRPLPGVYIEEMSRMVPRIEGVATAVAAFVGPAPRGPTARAKRRLRAFTSVADYERVHGGSAPLRDGTINHVAHAVRGFFAQGGRKLYVARVRAPTTAGYLQAIAKLESVADACTLAAPGVTTRDESLVDAVHAALLEQAARLLRFAVLDTAPSLSAADAQTARSRIDSAFGAVYYPWVVVADRVARSAELTLPPSGFICGVYARVDLDRGVNQVPANVVLHAVVRLEADVTRAEQEVLNPIGINCLRAFTGRGVRVWGGRTASSDPEWKYVNVRRYFNYLERSIGEGTRWAVFEANGETLWLRVRTSVENFLYGEWQRGALLGTKPEQAFFVRCDRTTMTRADIDAGRLIGMVGVAAVRPSEFVVFRFGQQIAG